MNKIFLLAIAVALLFTAQQTAAANLIVNGGFEEPVVTDPADWDIFTDGTAGLGWTVEWRSDIPTDWGGYARPDPALQELHAGVNSWSPQEGNQYAELDADWYGPGHPQNNEPASIKIYQDLTTGAGCEYSVKFYFSPRPNTPADDNVLEFRWNGNMEETITRGNATNQTDWSEHTYNLEATGATTRIEFTDLGIANSLGTFLDDVVVEEVSCPCPEPPSSGQINIGNFAIVRNQVTSISDTGGNEIVDVASGGGDNNGDNTINTGDATSQAGAINIVNSNLINGCCDGGSQINLWNRAMVGNNVFAGSYTGGNKIIDIAKYGGDSDGNNRITTGDADSTAGVFNFINSNRRRAGIR